MVVTSALMLPFLEVPGYMPFPALGLADDVAAGACVSPPAAAVVSSVPAAAVVVSPAAAVVSGVVVLPPHAASDSTMADAITNDSNLFFTRLSSSFLINNMFSAL